MLNIFGEELKGLHIDELMLLLSRMQKEYGNREVVIEIEIDNPDKEEEYLVTGYPNSVKFDKGDGKVVIGLKNCFEV